MVEINYTLLDVFTDTAFTGNPLAVFWDAEGIDSEICQKIASELNLSEIIFLESLRNSTVKARIFTPKKEIPFAGHPLIGAAIAIFTKLNYNEINFELRCGTVNIKSTKESARLKAPLKPEKLKIKISPEKAAKILSIKASDIISIEKWSAGLPFSFFEIKNPQILKNISFNYSEWLKLYKKDLIDDVCAFSVTHENSSKPLISSRVFAPSDNILEDPATGSAACALIGMLNKRGITSVLINQGVFIGRPSQILAELKDSESFIEGKAVIVGKGFIKV